MLCLENGVCDCVVYGSSVEPFSEGAQRQSSVALQSTGRDNRSFRSHAQGQLNYSAMIHLYSTIFLESFRGIIAVLWWLPDIHLNCLHSCMHVTAMALVT